MKANVLIYSEKNPQFQLMKLTPELKNTAWAVVAYYKGTYEFYSTFYKENPSLRTTKMYLQGYVKHRKILLNKLENRFKCNVRLFIITDNKDMNARIKNKWIPYHFRKINPSASFCISL